VPGSRADDKKSEGGSQLPNEPAGSSRCAPSFHSRTNKKSKSHKDTLKLSILTTVFYPLYIYSICKIHYINLFDIHKFCVLTTLLYLHNATVGSQPVARTLSSALRQSGCPNGVCGGAGLKWRYEPDTHGGFDKQKDIYIYTQNNDNNNNNTYV